MEKKIISVIVMTFCVLLMMSGCSAQETKKETYTVNFNTDGGSFIEAVLVEEGATVTKPADPVKDGAVFTEWKLNGVTYDFSKPVTTNITLVATYEVINSCTVKIGEQSYVVSFGQGETPKVDTPQAPEGMYFAGWKIDGTVGELSLAKNGSTIEAVFESVSVPCEKITTRYNNYWSIEGSKSYSLGIELTPANTTDKLTLTSDDEKVVKVDNEGNVYVGSPGTTKIHIKCGKIEKTVGFETRTSKVEPTDIHVRPKTLEMSVGDDELLTVTFEPQNAEGAKITYKSSDPSICTVSEDGYVSGWKAGEAIVTVTVGSISKTCKVIVKP